jgi:hypothetical protein
MREMLASPVRSKAPGSARTSYWSPTAGSPKAPPDCASDMSPRRPPTPARSPLSRTATGIRLDVGAKQLDLLANPAELRRAAGGTPREPRYRTVLAKYTKLVSSAFSGAVLGASRNSGTGPNLLRTWTRSGPEEPGRCQRLG